MHKYLILLLFTFSLQAAQIVPDARKVDWTRANVGVKNGIPSVTTISTTVGLGGTSSDIDTAMSAASSNTVVQLSATTYNFSGNLDWQGKPNGIVLRGTTNALGQPTTRLLFSSGSMLFRKIFCESCLATATNITVDGVKDGTTLTMNSVPSWIKVGYNYIIDQLDDTNSVSLPVNSVTGREGSDCYRMRAIIGAGPRGAAQQFKVVAKTATTITTELPLHWGWSVSQTAQIAQPAFDTSGSTTPRTMCGIEDLIIEQTYTSGSSDMIEAANLDNCWIKNIVSTNLAGHDHVIAFFCYRLEVRDSLFTKSKALNAGQGYGVALYDVNSACLVENNAFDGLHVSMQINYGSSGNVYDYNFQTNGVSDASVNEHPGIDTHGHHSMMNLWEGNYVANKAMFDCIHGSASHHTLLRNRILGQNANSPIDANGDWICIALEHWNRKHNALGNVLGSSRPNYSFQAASSYTTSDKVIWSFGYVNNQGGSTNGQDGHVHFDSFATLDPVIAVNKDAVTSTNNGIVLGGFSTNDVPNSFVYTSRPAWWPTSLAWPPYDPNMTLAGASATVLPAGYRFFNNWQNAPDSSGPGPVGTIPFRKARGQRSSSGGFVR